MPRPNRGMRSTGIYLAADQLEQLTAIAEARGVSQSDVIREAVTNYLAAGNTVTIAAGVSEHVGGKLSAAVRQNRAALDRLED